MSRFSVYIDLDAFIWFVHLSQIIGPCILILQVVMGVLDIICLYPKFCLVIYLCV